MNVFRLTCSNGIIKRTNNKIKVIKRDAYYYRNFINFRSRSYSIQALLVRTHASDTKIKQLQRPLDVGLILFT